MKHCLPLPLSYDWTPEQVSFIFDLLNQLSEALLLQHGDILGSDEDEEECFQILLDRLAWEASASLSTGSPDDDIAF